MRKELEKIFGQPRSRETQPLHLSVHEVHSLVKVKKSQGNQKRFTVSDGQTAATYALVAKGEPPCIDLPQSFEYHDALNSWISTIMTLETSSFTWQRLINGCRWPDLQIAPHNRERKMAPHMVYVQNGRRAEPQLNALDFSDRSDGKVVRLKISGSRDRLLDIKSRNVDKNSLQHQLECISRAEKPLFQKVCQEILEQPNNMIISESQVFGVFYNKLLACLSKSYRYPTIGLKHTILPEPSALGHCSEAHPGQPTLVNKFDGRAHIRFCEVDLDAVIPSKDEVIDILRVIAERVAANPNGI